MRSWVHAVVTALSLCVLGACAGEAKAQHYYWGWPPGYYPGYSGYGSGTYYSPGYYSRRTYNFGSFRIYPIIDPIYSTSYEPYYAPPPFDPRYTNPPSLGPGELGFSYGAYVRYGGYYGRWWR